VSDNLDKTHSEEEAAHRGFAPDGEVRPPLAGSNPSIPEAVPSFTAVPDDQLPHPDPVLDNFDGEAKPANTLGAADADATDSLDETVPLESAIAATEPEAPTIEETPTAAQRRRRKSFWREVLETVLLTILIFFLVKSLIQNFRIQGSSMEPNFHTNQLLLVNKAAYFHFDINAWLRIIPGVNADGTNVVWLFGGPHRGDVVVLEPPDVPTEDYIKRVIALPGEKIEVRDGTVFINDKPLKENYIKEKPYSTYGPAVVPPNTIFVMGDNRNASRDSRIFGFLPFDKVVGKAMFIYWPFGEQWGIVPEAKY
jgi:signal peptidase I